VLEGLFSFLPFQTLHQNNSMALTNFPVLNSLLFFKKSREVLEQHQQINLNFGRDSSDLKYLQNALNWNKKYIGKSEHYQHHKDFNDYSFIKFINKRRLARQEGLFEFNGASYVLPSSKLLALLMLSHSSRKI
jgi:hypothetical protein